MSSIALGRCTCGSAETGNVGLRTTKAARLTGGVRGRAAKLSVSPSPRRRGVVGHRHQVVELRVGAAQQGAQRVVLPEEGVEPAAHRPPGAVLHRPGAHPSAQLVARLEKGHAHPALGEDGGRREAGDAAPDDDHVLAVGPVGARLGPVQDGGAVPAGRGG